MFIIELEKLELIWAQRTLDPSSLSKDLAQRI